MADQTTTSISPESTGSFVGRMAEAVGARANASTVFGPSVTQDGTTVIPVALAVWAFGGGTGMKNGGKAATEAGAGGGGGARVRPVGYIILRGGRVRYRPIMAFPPLLLAALVGAGVAVLVRRRTGAEPRRG
jgi:uncharacterized spore protein YtfJ